MNPFTTLGLANTATPTEVKKAYRALLRQVHPDVAGEAGHEATVELVAAYTEALAVARTVAPPAVAARPGFVPARHRAYGARTRSAFVASTFTVVA